MLGSLAVADQVYVGKSTETKIRIENIIRLEQRENTNKGERTQKGSIGYKKERNFMSIFWKSCYCIGRLSLLQQCGIKTIRKRE